METPFQSAFKKLEANVNSFVRGQGKLVELALICLFAEGHLLIEGNPGTAKTSLARAIAQSIEGATVKRIQFTPDLLPADVTGSDVYRGERFEFVGGPVFTNILLGDEINRASPKTQSALLEVMAERQVTSGVETHKVDGLFMVIATQNPIEHYGVYPLPEAQLDRFLMRLCIDYPDRAAEVEVVVGGAQRTTPDTLDHVISLAEVEGFADEVRRVHVGKDVATYIVDLVNHTRPKDRDSDIRLGASPRGAIALATAAQAHAAARGSADVFVQDVQEVVHAVLGHRLIMTSDAQRSATEVVQEIIKSMRAPEHRAFGSPR